MSILRRLSHRIFFGPKFLDELSDSELDFIMMHEILHVVLQHCMRQGDYDSEQFNIACDIVVNSNILLSNNMNRNSIKLKKYGESMHIAPDGKEGYEYTAEQIYAMLPPMPKGKTPKPSLGASWDDHTRWSGSSEENNGENDEENEYLREQWEKWLIDVCEVISIRDSTKSFGGGPVLAQRILKQIRKGQIDWREILNNFVQEEITDYSFTPPDRRFDDSPFFLPDYNEKEESIGNIWFVIDTSGSISDDAIKAAYSEICSAIDQFNGKLSGILSFTESYVTDPVPFSSVDELMSIKPVGGGGPVLAQRILKQIRKGQIDWREILNNFVQEEITDYSFTPPDRRFDDSPFFLPDYNEKEESIGNIWFVIDTSGSISDDAIKAAYSEICSAIDQFNGKLSGILSFTESYVTDPVPFSSVDELMSIKPVGGGGNDFSDIFRYMKNHMLNELPSQIIIITDGYDSFPPEEAAMEIPVLWLLNNEEVNPPWGKIARIVV